VRNAPELNSVNAFYSRSSAACRGGVVVLNTDLIQIWNHEAEEYGTCGGNARTTLSELRYWLPVEQLRQPLRKCLLERPRYVEVTFSHKSPWLGNQSKITCTPLKGMENELQVIMIMEQQSESQLKILKLYL